MDRKQLAGMIDQTLLSPLATDEQVERFCLEALEYGFASVCINPVHVKKAASVLKGSGKDMFKTALVYSSEGKGLLGWKESAT